MSNEPDFELVTGAIGLPEQRARFARLQVAPSGQQQRTFHIASQAAFDLHQKPKPS